jgi:hypothetical protein
VVVIVVVIVMVVMGGGRRGRSQMKCDNSKKCKGTEKKRSRKK